MRRVEPGYRKQEVDEILFNAYVSLARQYLAEERWEESVQNFDKALNVLADALKLFRAVGDKLGEANTLRAIGDVQAFKKENDAVLVSFQQALALYKDVGARLGEANTYRSLGLLELEKTDDMRVADGWLEKAVALHTTIGDRYSVAVDYWYFADRSHKKGDKARAKIYAAKAEPIFRSLNLPFADRMKEIIDETE